MNRRFARRRVGSLVSVLVPFLLYVLLYADGVDASSERLVSEEARYDLGSAMLWAAGGLGIRLGYEQETRWKRSNSFDRPVRNEMRLSASAQKDAEEASDWLLISSVSLLPLAAPVNRWIADDPAAHREALEMTASAADALALTFFVTESVKAAAGRERPFVRDCESGDRTRGCDEDSRKKSFFSGHSSLSAAGAGVMCSQSIRRQAWGADRVARTAPCLLGTGVALTTGLLRIAADKHWLSDVLVGWAVGGSIGFFEQYGPGDWLRFEINRKADRSAVRGTVLPYTSADGAVGAQLALTY